jgi:hypothetical protein
MIARYRALRQRIADELAQLERTRDAALRHWRRAQHEPDDPDAYINSVALNLHSLYSGLERIFELIAVELDGGALGGADWHTELLRQMTLDLTPVRPAVITKDTAARLDEHRKFRHRIRNVYAADLDPERMEPLIDGLPALWEAVSAELANFSTFLTNISRADEAPPTAT